MEFTPFKSLGGEFDRSHAPSDRRASRSRLLIHGYYAGVIWRWHVRQATISAALLSSDASKSQTRFILSVAFCMNTKLASDLYFGTMTW
jgi:hypothetical protein